jgi:REP element-mobilizing transposase RayT
MPRRARLDSPGTLHHVIVRGIEKRRIVDNDTDREDLVSRMGGLALETDTQIYAWALMANHAHILLASGPDGLSKFMRRLLTGHAVRYNRRHKRHGHLFQNRYKSIVCDADVYFRELVRYIHLNPLRGKVVRGISALGRYPWCGHAVLLGNVEHAWQSRGYVLEWFGRDEEEAKAAYMQYVREGIRQGRRPDLVGGGLVRSVGGWAEVLSLRRDNERVLTDQRVLGTDAFVEGILKEASRQMQHRVAARGRRKEAEGLVRDACASAGVSLRSMRMGSRRGAIPKVRGRLAQELVRDLGLSLAETARMLGVSTPAISNILKRSQEE